MPQSSSDPGALIITLPNRSGAPTRLCLHPDARPAASMPRPTGWEALADAVMGFDLSRDLGFGD